jgi:hypothetical protein
MNGLLAIPHCSAMVRSRRSIARAQPPVDRAVDRVGLLGLRRQLRQPHAALVGELAEDVAAGDVAAVERTGERLGERRAAAAGRARDGDEEVRREAAPGDRIEVHAAWRRCGGIGVRGMRHG